MAKMWKKGFVARPFGTFAPSSQAVPFGLTKAAEDGHFLRNQRFAVPANYPCGGGFATPTPARGFVYCLFRWSVRLPVERSLRKRVPCPDRTVGVKVACATFIKNLRSRTRHALVLPYPIVQRIALFLRDFRVLKVVLGRAGSGVD